MVGSRFDSPRLARGLYGLVAGLVVAAIGAADVTAQATGTVTGVVRNAANGQPLPGAQVSAEGTGIGGLANNIGRYLLLNVPAGQHTVNVQLIGYGEASQTVDVAAGGTAQADFGLHEAALALEGVIVTGTAGQARRREVGNQISEVGQADIALAAISDVSQLIQGRATGVQVNPMGGQVGGGSQIRLRGVNSLEAGDNPLIYIDGMRMEADVLSVDDEAAASPSAFDMINPNDIARIEIVKGPAATTLYGTEAAGGVIQIFTKRGSAGAPAWTFSANGGMRKMPFQGGSLNPESINPTGFYLNDCSVLREYDASAMQFVTIDEPQPGCPASGSWFRTGYLQRYNLSVRGGSEAVTYFVSGRYEDEQGVVDPQNASSYGVRANISFQPFDGLNVSFNNSYQRRDIIWIPNGNNASGFNLNVMRGTAGYTPDNNDALVFENDIISNVDQFQTSMNVGWTPSSAWAHRLNVGMDYTTQDFLDWKYWDYYSEPTGQRENDHTMDRNLTFDYSGSFRYDVLSDLASTFSFGGQLYEEFEYQLNGFDEVFAGPGEPAVGDGTQRDVDEDRERIRSGGFFVQEQLGWQDKLFVTAGMRWDGFSTFGEGFGLAAYPKISGSYILSDESFWPSDLVESLKLRVAWGQSGKAPGVFEAEKLWDATSADEGVPAVVLNNFGNPDLGPERSTELEWGADLSTFDGRLTIEFTKYDQVTKDALIELQPGPASSGTNNEVWQNLGEVKNWGTETSVNVVPVRTDDVEWSVGVGYSTNGSEVVELGPVDEIGGDIHEGFPLRAFFDDVLQTDCIEDDPDFPNCSTWDPNGFYDPANEPQLAERFLGRLFPTDILNLNTRVTLWQSLTLDVLAEGQFGHFREIGHAYQNMRRSSLTNPVWPVCMPIIAVWETGDRTTLTNQQVVECIENYSDSGVWDAQGSADFVKIRSATLAWRLPDGWVPGTRSVQLTVQGSNLFTFTDYIGLDPEASDDGPTDQTPDDYYTYGPPRVFIFGVTVNF